MSDPITRKQRDEATAEDARKAIAHVRELAANPSFVWFMGLLRQRCDSMADDVLHDNALTPEAREALRRERLGILEALRTPADTEQAQSALLASLEPTTRPRGE